MKEPSQRLGRGLASLFGDAEHPSVQASVGEIPVGHLEANPFQPRGVIHVSDLQDLIASIASSGVLQPLLVRPHPARPGHYQIVAGERRWQAAKVVGLNTVPCLIRDLKDQEAAAAALVENLQRQDLNAIEEAEGFRKLITSFGLTQDELAAAVGKSRSHVANALRLLNLPEVVAQQVRDGLLTAGHARAALACPDPIAAAEQIIAQDLNVRQAEKLRPLNAEARGQKRSSISAVQDPDHLAIEADLAEALGLRVRVSSSGDAGTVHIHYQTLDQLDNIVKRLTQ